MTPEAKAKELIDKFKEHAYYDYHDLTPMRQRRESKLENAKECAQICVEEVLNEQVRVDYLTPEAYNLQKEYWHEVLTHLK